MKFTINLLHNFSVTNYSLKYSFLRLVGLQTHVRVEMDLMCTKVK